MNGKVVYIVSGDVGSSAGQRAVYVGKQTEFALKWHLAQTRKRGKMWARAVYYIDDTEHDYWTGEVSPIGDGGHLTFWKPLPPRKTSAPVVYIGEDNHQAKLTTPMVQEIRCLHDSGVSDTRIAKRFEISRKQVQNIRERKSWAHV